MNPNKPPSELREDISEAKPEAVIRRVLLIGVSNRYS